MPSQPAKKKRKTIVVKVEDESDDDIEVIETIRPSSHPSSQCSYQEPNPQDNPEAFYGQRQQPKFHPRNLERALQKEIAWSKPLPEVHDLFFVATTPKKLEELAVNPRQLSKLKTLLTQGQGGTLLVTGPSGCGSYSFSLLYIFRR
ncbi:unnamed protein product [Haemonchus placei]|uniref:ATP-dependent DNA helicase n=1 Tax=Haemonchus placei TaxID=6290 RepID=A0A0N4WRU3_HAEPC|nr:unnamed protein product [Haemonchus placei]